MQFVAKTKYIRYSPFKLRPLADVVRGKNVTYAIEWLSTYPVKRSLPLRKAIESAAANAKFLNNLDQENLSVKEIRIDHGPAVRYYKPGAMGRANLQRRRSCHVNVVLESIDTVKKEA